jgi:hypothetical protein
MKKQTKISKFMGWLLHYSPVSIDLSPEGLMLLFDRIKAESHEF